jgi:hypothetical protein
MCRDFKLRHYHTTKILELRSPEMLIFAPNYLLRRRKY